MSRALVFFCAAALVSHVQSAPKSSKDESKCEVRVRLQDGWVCGVLGTTENRTDYASFLGVPYAKQPIGERRFSELEPNDPWEGCYDATTEGPICPQYDTLYGSLLMPTSISEACINANIHVPLHALPGYSTLRPARHLRTPHETGLSDKDQSDGEDAPGLPILVFIHGGGFAFGSGGIGLHGPQYLMNKDVIVITFNYRVNVFGFLSLNSTSIPGNNGLRDMITLLKWVQANARFFGGDPDNVTLGGQSAGSSSAHILSMSRAAKGLFKRAILMSGTGMPRFFTTSPIYAKFVADQFLTTVGVNVSNPEDIHQQLIEMPIEKIMEANKEIQEKFGVISFYPVVETPVPGFTTIIDEDPETLMAKGVGKNIPLLIGFTNEECETFRLLFEKVDMLDRIKKNPLLILAANLIYKVPQKDSLDAALKEETRYFHGEPTMDKYLQCCSDNYYAYPAIKLTRDRASMNGAPVFLYQYSYEADFSVMKKSLSIEFNGAGHIEDVNFIFRANAMNGTEGFSTRSVKDNNMVEWMTTFVKNFMTCNDPTCAGGHRSMWPAAAKNQPIHYQNIETPFKYNYRKLTRSQQEMVEFFDKVEGVTR